MAVGELATPLELVDVLGRPGERVAERRVELRTVGERDRAADLGDQLLTHLFLLALDRLVELQQALLAERVVRRPVGLVERAAGRGDGALHVFRRRVGHLPEHLFGRRVDVVERLARRCLDELAVDEHADLALYGGRAVGFGGGHGGAPCCCVGAQTLTRLLCGCPYRDMQGQRPQ